MNNYDKVTSETLREMAMGRPETFNLPDANAILTAKSQAYRMARIQGCRFKAESDFTNNTLTLIKLPR